jgi:hypothetical protein
VSAPIECEDCGEEMPPNTRRRTCSHCGLKVCGWCDHHRALETEVVATRALRNAETPGRYKHAAGSFFQSNAGRDGFTPIDEVVAWSRTERGGRQLPLLAPAPSDGCMRWGLCDPPTKEVA